MIGPHRYLAGFAWAIALVLGAATSLAFAAPASAAQGSASQKSAGPGAIELEVSAMAFNVRYGAANDGPDRWSARRELVFEVLRSSGADFLGLQEALPFQLEEIQAELSGYGVISRTRDADPATGESCPILYRRDRWRLDRREQGAFWLSPTPDDPGSRGWDAALPRIVTWGRFDHLATGARLYVLNTHFDHRGGRARVESAKLLRRKIEELAADSPLLILGDWNSGEESEAMTLLRGTAEDAHHLVDPYRVLHPAATEVATFHGFRTEEFTGIGDKIDAILVRSGTEVVAAEILRPRFAGRAPSDHDPVTATIRIQLAVTAVEIGDLGGCAGCGSSVERSLGRLEGVLRARLRPESERIEITSRPGRGPSDEEIAEAVRRVGYTVTAIERGYSSLP